MKKFWSGKERKANRLQARSKDTSTGESWIARHFWLWGAIAISLIFPAAGSVLVAAGVRGKPVIDPNTGLEKTDLEFWESVTWLPLSWGIACFAVGFALNIANQIHSRKILGASDALRRANLTRFNDELSSMIGVFTELLESPKDKTAGERFFASAVREARHLVSHSGVRICVYEMELQEVDHSQTPEEANGDRTEQKPEDKYLLVLKSFGGRADRPRETFTPDSEHGKNVIATALGTTAVRISNPKTAPFTVDRQDDAVWCSTLLVPLKHGNKPFGVMMIDTREQVDFSFDDISIGWTIATIIALGMSSLVFGGEDGEPEYIEAKQQLISLELADEN